MHIIINKSYIMKVKESTRGLQYGFSITAESALIVLYCSQHIGSLRSNPSTGYDWSDWSSWSP